MNAILLFFHCPANSGYAIAPLERAFGEVGERLTGSRDRVHFAYTGLTAGTNAQTADGRPAIRFDSREAEGENSRQLTEYLRANRIDVALGFDQPPRRPGFRALRAGGVRTFVSYWGAPMSSLNSGLKLALKRLEVRLLGQGGPDHYIFESYGMLRTAVNGRGVPEGITSVTRLGIDPDKFVPPTEQSWYAHDTFGIPRDRKIIFYAGHMEERKGVHVIVKAAVELVDKRGVRDAHFLFLGNKNDEAAQYDSIYRGTAAEQFITFGGYRKDIAQILPCSFVGTIASTGWDSFPRSSLEMAGCGLPLLVSRLPGLDETVEDGVTGFTFGVGDHAGLADRVVSLLSEPGRRDIMSRAARKRVVEGFTIEKQLDSLEATMRRADALTRKA